MIDVGNLDSSYNWVKEQEQERFERFHLPEFKSNFTHFAWPFDAARWRATSWVSWSLKFGDTFFWYKTHFKSSSRPSLAEKNNVCFCPISNPSLIILAKAKKRLSQQKQSRKSLRSTTMNEVNTKLFLPSDKPRGLG